MQGKRGEKLEDVFWPKVDVGDIHDCWNWKAACKSSGYGGFDFQGKTLAARRVAWELYYKQKVPEGMYILHHCDNPKCCNHMHLYCGTHADNMRDRTLRGRDGVWRKNFGTNNKEKR